MSLPPLQPLLLFFLTMVIFIADDETFLEMAWPSCIESFCT